MHLLTQCPVTFFVVALPQVMIKMVDSLQGNQQTVLPSWGVWMYKPCTGPRQSHSS